MLLHKPRSSKHLNSRFSWQWPLDCGEEVGEVKIKVRCSTVVEAHQCFVCFVTSLIWLCFRGNNVKVKESRSVQEGLYVLTASVHNMDQKPTRCHACMLVCVLGCVCVFVCVHVSVHVSALNPAFILQVIKDLLIVRFPIFRKTFLLTFCMFYV